jgi:hypothetical protein
MSNVWCVFDFQQLEVKFQYEIFLYISKTEPVCLKLVTVINTTYPSFISPIRRKLNVDEIVLYCHFRKLYSCLFLMQFIIHLAIVCTFCYSSRRLKYACYCAVLFIFSC